MTAVPSNQQFQKFRKHLEQEGFCLLVNTKFKELVLYNWISNATEPLSVLPLRFKRWDDTKSDATGITDYIKCSLELISGEVFLPDGGRYISSYGSTWVNLHKPFQTSSESCEVSPLFLEFFERLFPINEERHVCVQWMADIVQNPQHRPSWHLLLSSAAGTGKGFLFHNILSPIIRHTHLVKDYDGLMGKHSVALAHNLLILLDDAKTSSDHMQTKLKSALSEPRVAIEPKHEMPRMVDTYARVILASNELRPLRLDKDERRWYVPQRIEHRTSLEETADFIAKLAKWLEEPDSLSKVYNYFKTYSMEGFNRKYVHQTETLKAMIGMSESPIEGFLSAYLEDEPVFTYNGIQEALASEGYNRQKDTYIKRLLNESGYVSGRFKRNSITLWHPRSLSKETALAKFEAAPSVL
ncbi:primase-helicase family protein [Herbaspirillum huttiense]|uniref:primase-helicase family protein n=1 Tax=Herbaspirillum huttiense TaxID=863372 RepID=UPI0039AEF51D